MCGSHSALNKGSRDLNLGPQVTPVIPVLRRLKQEEVPGIQGQPRFYSDSSKNPKQMLNKHCS